MRSKRLQPGDRDLARALFSLMADVFAEERDVLSDAYLDRILSSEAFVAVAAFDGDELIGGATAHILAMTRGEASELFVYDIAVRQDHQRTGVGRQLITDLRSIAVAGRIRELFVFADNDDLHALDFYRALGGLATPVTSFTFAGCDSSESGPQLD